MERSDLARPQCCPEGEPPASQFIHRELRAWLEDAGIKTPNIEPGSPWQNGFIESFHSSFRRGCLDREQLWSPSEARVVIEDWRCKYNAVCPHKSIRLETPLDFARGAADQAADSGRAMPSVHPLLDVASLKERYSKLKPERLRLSFPVG